jgi:hypothetical protein
MVEPEVMRTSARRRRPATVGAGAETARLPRR